MIISPPDSEVASLFRDGELVMWPKLTLKHMGELSRLPVHNVQRWKKLKSRDALSAVGDISNHALSVWTRDADEARIIQRMLKDTEDEMRAFVQSLFPTVKLGDEMHSWRFTVTKNEPLHFDVYAERVRTPVIRIFLNLDDKPRVWDIGPLDDGSDGYMNAEYRARVLLHATPKRFEFPPGSAWMVDSRRVAHAIIFGRRAAMFSWET